MTVSLKHHSRRYDASSRVYRTVFLITLIMLGVLLLIFTQALTPTASLEPENGNATSGAKVVTSADASGGKAVQFTRSTLGCVYTEPVLANLWGGMTYVTYTFNQQDMYQITSDVDLLNSPPSTNDFYIQMYNSNIGTAWQYNGIQTTGLVLWSRFYTQDTGNVRPNGASYVFHSSAENQYISLRRDYGSMPQGHYKTRIVRAEFDGVGDWFQYYVTFPGRSEDYIGDMRFPRVTSGVPATIHDGGQQWNEFVENNAGVLKPVPLIQINTKLTVNNALEAAHAVGSYSKMPNSDMYVLDRPGGYVHHEIGSTSARCHFPDANGNLTLW